MRRTEIKKSIERLEELKETIYEALDEIKDVLREVAPEELERAEVYWLAHIDGALENRGQWLGGSMISYINTIEALEEMMEEEWEVEDMISYTGTIYALEEMMEEEWEDEEE